MKKAGWYLMSVLPLLATLGIQIVGAVIITIVYMVRYGMETGTQLYMNDLMKVLVVIQIATLIITGIWYYFLVLHKRAFSLRESAKRLSWKSVGIIFCLAIGLQGLTQLLIVVWQYISPEQVESYTALMEESGVGTLTVFSVMATVILAPIGEEIVFRGLVVEYLKRAKARLWVIIVIQALFFGIVHLNLVQGTYAFMIGLVSGYLLLRYETILAPMLLHMFLNGYATFGTPLIEKLDPNMYIMGCVIMGVLLVPLGLWMLQKDIKKEGAVGK